MITPLVFAMANKNVYRFSMSVYFFSKDMLLHHKAFLSKDILFSPIKVILQMLRLLEEQLSHNNLSKSSRYYEIGWWGCFFFLLYLFVILVLLFFITVTVLSGFVSGKLVKM
jgi:hypothetical protein